MQARPKKKNKRKTKFKYISGSPCKRLKVSLSSCEEGGVVRGRGEDEDDNGDHLNSPPPIFKLSCRLESKLLNSAVSAVLTCTDFTGSIS